MCEFFYAHSKQDGLDRSTLRTVLKAAQRAALTNPHGTGIFNEDGVVFRTDRPIDGELTDRIIPLFEGSEKVVVHLRMATRGARDLTNVHPFVGDGLMLAHNGQVHGLNEYGDSSDADSKMLLRKITAQSGDTIEKVQEALSTTTGWLSIFLLNRRTGDLYYFRDGADLYVRESEELVVGATKRTRIEGAVESPESNVVYLLDDGFTPVAEFETSGFSRGSGRSGGRGHSFGEPYRYDGFYREAWGDLEQDGAWRSTQNQEAAEG